MKKGLLLCSGGMSTTMMAKELEKLAKNDGQEWQWKAMGTMATNDNWEESVANYDFVFMSPQIVFFHSKIKEVADNAGVPVQPIPPQEYIVLKANLLWEKVKKATA